LDQTLKEEKKTDDKLTALAREINPQAHEEETGEPKAPRRAA
jgi:ferritin-like metal-binding protein YciE